MATVIDCSYDLGVWSEITTFLEYEDRIMSTIKRDDMLETLLGKIEILTNGIKTNYVYTKLDNKKENFKVDERFKIAISIKDLIKQMGSRITVQCNLLENVSNNIEKYIESGERLAMLSFYSEHKKVSIGVEDELPDIIYTYEKNGIKLSIPRESKIDQITFGIAGLIISDIEREDIYTWFAGDPTMYKAYGDI